MPPGRIQNTFLTQAKQAVPEVQRGHISSLLPLSSLDSQRTHPTWGMKVREPMKLDQRHSLDPALRGLVVVFAVSPAYFRNRGIPQAPL